MQFRLLLATAFTAINRHQLTGFNVKLLIFNNRPFVKAIAAQAGSSELIRQSWSLEWDNFSHGTPYTSLATIRLASIRLAATALATTRLLSRLE